MELKIGTPVTIVSNNNLVYNDYYYLGNGAIGRMNLPYNTDDIFYIPCFNIHKEDWIKLINFAIRKINKSIKDMEMKGITLNGTSTYGNVRFTRSEIREYIQNNKELQALMKKYGIVWRFKNESSNHDWDEEIYFCDYNIKDHNDFTNIDNFITELKEKFPLFLIRENTKTHKELFGNTYDNTFWQIDKKGRDYHFIYFNNYSFKEDNVKLGVELDDKLIKVIKDYYNNTLNKDYNVIKSKGKRNYEGDIEPYEALILIGGGKDNTRLIDQLNVFIYCLYNTKTKKLELNDWVEIPYSE